MFQADGAHPSNLLGASHFELPWRGLFWQDGLGYLAPVDFVRRYYDKLQAKEAKQTLEMAGSLSL